MLLLFILIFLHFCITTLPINVLAAGTTNSTSDVQLLARAINGEARGETYEGQVAVRSCNFK